MTSAEFPSNSKHPRPGGEPPKKTERVVEQVVANEVTSRKKSIGRRLKELIIGGDSKTALNYVITDVIVPQAKDMLAEALSQGFERVIYGENRNGRRRSGTRPTTTPNYTNYNRYSSRGNNPIGRSGREDRPTASIQSRDIDDIIFATEIEADTVLDRLYDLVQEYGMVSIADLHSLIGWSSSHTDQKWGWETLQGSGVQRVRGGGYAMNLPKPHPLD